MSTSDLIAFLPEFVLLFGTLGIFLVSLGDHRGPLARRGALLTAAALIATCAGSLGASGLLFDGAYRVDAFSQLLKLTLAVAFLGVVLADGGLPDIRDEVKPEYYLLLAFSMVGLVLLVSSVEVITLVIALELSSFPLFLMVPMRRERAGRGNQMEAAAKYIMFGVAATGIMLFGLSYLFGLTGTLHLDQLAPRLRPLLGSPVALIGLAMTFCGLYFKLAVFPFHYWSPDVYQGSATETAGAIATLPKLGAVAVLVRLVSLVTPGEPTVALLLAVLAVASMFYGNLIALAQTDVKRLLGFSAIAHAGYALVGFVALDATGYAAALFYLIGYLGLVLACFAVLRGLAPGGADLALSDLAGLHRRAPLLAATLATGALGLAGLPPFAGFMGKLMLLKAALAQGHLTLVLLTVISTAIAIYYYLQIVREVYFREADDRPAVVVAPSLRLLCVALIVVSLWLGLAPDLLLTPLVQAVTSTLPH